MHLAITKSGCDLRFTINGRWHEWPRRMFAPQANPFAALGRGAIGRREIIGSPMTTLRTTGACPPPRVPLTQHPGPVCVDISNSDDEDDTGTVSAQAGPIVLFDRGGLIHFWVASVGPQELRGTRRQIADGVAPQLLMAATGVRDGGDDGNIGHRPYRIQSDNARSLVRLVMSRTLRMGWSDSLDAEDAVKAGGQTSC